MDEAGARALMERLSTTEQPPSRVDIGLARQRGGTLLRRRRWGLTGVPVLAAATVAAVTLGAGAITGAGRPGGGRPTAPAVSAHHLFNPLAPYAAFGWLPDGIPLAASSPDSAPTVLQLTAGSAAKGQFMLAVWAPAACNLDAAQVPAALHSHHHLDAAQALAALHRHHHPTLSCMQDAVQGWALQLARPAPAVAGRPAFWITGQWLAWEYAPHAWATLDVYRHGAPGFPAGVIVKVAAHIRYAASAKPVVKLPFRLTGVPASWRVLKANWAATADGLLGARSSDMGDYTTVGPPHGRVTGVIGEIVIMPGKSRCPFLHGSHGSSRRVVLGGVTAIVTHFPGDGIPPYQGLCVPETDGLHVSFLEFRGPGHTGLAFGGVTGVFSHLRLLGPDPANWTTRPLG
jgi:hypothetical protein